MEEEPDMIKQHFDKAYGLNAPENYERFFVPVIAEPLAKDLIRRAALRPGERVLDVASGTGILARLALQHVGDSGKVAGLDINSAMLTFARSISKDLSIEWYEASAENLPLPDESFDVALCQLGLQFMKDKAVALGEIYRILMTGGRLTLNVAGPASKPMAILAEALERHISPETGGFVSQVFSLYDPAELQELANSAGFCEIDIKTQNKMFSLPAPKDFLWQYVYSTPLARAVREADEHTQKALQNDVVEQWQEFVDEDTFKYYQCIVTVYARK